MMTFKELIEQLTQISETEAIELSIAKNTAERRRKAILKRFIDEGNAAESAKVSEIIQN